MDRLYGLCGMTSFNSKVKDIILGLSSCNQSKFSKVQEKKKAIKIFVLFGVGFFLYFIFLLL